MIPWLKLALNEKKTALKIIVIKMKANKMCDSHLIKLNGRTVNEVCYYND